MTGKNMIKNEEGDRNENNIKETIWDVHCIRMDKS